MDKDIITQEELQQLVYSSRNIRLGETVTGTIVEKEIYSNNYGVTFPKFERDDKPKPKGINLRRDFFKFLNDFEKKLNYRLLNSGRDGVIYHYDSLGRVYFKSTMGQIYYINSSKTGCINEYGEYFDLRSTPNGVEIIPNPTLDFGTFPFLFITIEAERLAKAKTEKTTEREVEPFSNNPFSELFNDEPSEPENKVIDFTAYREKHSEHHHR